MKKIVYVLFALLLCATFIGSVSAFTYTSNATVDPSGSLSPGEDVIATMAIKISSTESIGNYNIYLSTPLEEATWSLSIYDTDGSGTPGAVALSTPVYQGKSATVSGFSLDYSKGSYLSIVLSGKVSTDSSGKSISVMKINQVLTTGGTAVSSYTAPEQMVYDPDDLSSQITAVESEITTLESRIAIYSGYGIDVSAQVTELESAKTNLASAKSAGTADIVNANKYLEAATTSLNTVERSLSLAGLTAIKVNIDAVDLIVTKLDDKGWDNEANLLAITNQGIKNTYNLDTDRYDAGGSPNVDENLKASEQALTDGNAYLEQASASPLAALSGAIPIIIVVVVAIIVVVGVVFVIRKRRGGWDELG